MQAEPKVLNLTSEDIVLYNNTGVIAKLPSRGELRAIDTKGPRYPLHHIHYYDIATNTEAGIPVLSTKATILDKSSPGYMMLSDLNANDAIIVSQEVAQLVSSNNGIVVSEVFTVCTNEYALVRDSDGNVIGHKGLEWRYNVSG